VIEPAPFDPGAIGARSTPKQVEWMSRDCMLYALGVGMGVDDLAFTTNNTKGIEQRMVPTMPVTLGVDFSVLRAAGPFDWAKVLHAEQRVELLATIPVHGRAEAVTEITEMWDRGRQRSSWRRPREHRQTENRCGAALPGCSFAAPEDGAANVAPRLLV